MLLKKMCFTYSYISLLNKFSFVGYALSAKHHRYIIYRYKEIKYDLKLSDEITLKIHNITLQFRIVWFIQS